MSFDLFGMLEQSQATGLPFGGGLNSAGMADEQRNNDRGGNPRLPRPPRPQTVTAGTANRICHANDGPY